MDTATDYIFNDDAIDTIDHFLTPPIAGISKVYIGVYECEIPHYISLVAIECLSNMIHAMENFTDFVVPIVSGDKTIKIVADDSKVYAIVDENHKHAIYVNEDLDKSMIAHQMYYDIRENLESWTGWTPFFEDMTDEDDLKGSIELKRDKDRLSNQLNRLSQYLDDEDEFMF